MIRKKSLLMTFAFLIAVCLPFCFIGTPQGIREHNAEKVGAVKTYEYTISQNNSLFSVKGKNVNGDSYNINSNVWLSPIIEAIDNDRTTDNGLTYADCTLIFDSVVIGNDNISLTKGNYLIKGELTGNQENTSGLITNNGANVVFDNATIGNNGFSALIKNIGNGDITVNGGSYTGYSDAIVITENSSGKLTINYGDIFSETGYGIKGVSTNNVEININQLASKITKITSSQNSTVYLEKGTLNIAGGTITNLVNKYAVQTLSGVSIHLANSPIFITTSAQIATAQAIYASLNSVSFAPTSVLKIYFTSSIISSETIAVCGVNSVNSGKFTITNSKKKLVLDNENLIIHNYYKLTYNANCKQTQLITSNTEILAQQKLIYLKDAEVELIYFSREVREYFYFLGWSTTKNGAVEYDTTDDKLIFGEKDITLYAVWEAIVYTIEYDYDGGQPGGTEILTYTADTPNFTIAKPTKQYYDFIGWSIGASTLLDENYTVELGSHGSFKLTAHWKKHDYSITYIGKYNQTEINKTLKKTYQIYDENENYSLSSFYGYGYSTYGMFLDANYTTEFNGEISFDPEIEQQVVIGEEIKIYIQTKYFHTENGLGTQDNPYIINSQEQFNAFISGYKKSLQTKYVSLMTDLTFNTSLENVVEPLTNFVIEGNNHKITINAFNSYNGYIALLPYIKNTTIQNLTFETSALSHSFGTNTNIYFAEVVGLAETSNLNNIVLNSNINLSNLSCEQTIDAKIGTLACTIASNSVINNSQTNGVVNISLKNANNLDLSYGAVASYNASSLIVNTQNSTNTNINVVLANNQCECVILASGIANLDRDAKVFNCFNIGKINTGNLIVKQIILSGISNVLNIDSTIKNCYNIGEFVCAENVSNNAYQTIWSRNSTSVSKENLFGKTSDTYTTAITEEDFTNGELIKLLNDKISSLNSVLKASEYNLTLTKWYFGQDSTPQFNQSIKITFELQGILPNRSEWYFGTTDISNKFYPNTYKKYFFDGWFLDKNCTQAIDLTDVSDYSQLTVYAKFTPLSTVVNNAFVVYVILDILVLAGFFVCLYYFDRKKTVRFYSNGKMIAEAKYGRAQTIQLPNEFENMLWFEDIQGQKPFINRKMPHRPICLYTFNESKQKRMESKYYKELEEQEQQKLERAIAKAELLAQKQKEKEARKQQKLEIAKAKREARLERQELLRKERLAKQEKIKQEKYEREQERIRQEEEKKRLEEEKAKQTEITIDDHITVIKKEIKVIKNNKKE